MRYLHISTELNEEQLRKPWLILALMEGASESARGGGEGGRVPVAHNSNSINDIGMNFGGVVENHKLINLV